MKRCPTCKETKEELEFSKGGKSKPLHYECKICSRKRYLSKPKEWHEKERIRNRKRARVIRGLDPDYEGRYRNTPIANPDTSWKTPDGYVLIYRPNHPNKRANGLICQHVFIMSNHLNRPLKKDERVHHKNGIRDDNRIENLELWSTWQPKGQRIEDKLEWCKEFAAQYGYKVIKEKNG